MPNSFNTAKLPLNKFFYSGDVEEKIAAYSETSSQKQN